jgi:hypothetical protein
MHMDDELLNHVPDADFIEGIWVSVVISAIKRSSLSKSTREQSRPTARDCELNLSNNQSQSFASN